MSFLGPPFQHDLFVSYSHGDVDGSGESNLKTWSQAFARELEGELKLHPKFHRLQVFLDEHDRSDRNVDPMMPLTQQLRDDIGASGLLVILMSPHYLGSTWCQTERDWWVAAQEQHRLPLEGRVAVARIWPVDESEAEQWPPVLLDERREPLVGFTFYDRARADERPQPYEWPDPTGAKGPFRDELLDMVGRIWKRLAAVKAQLEAHERRQEESVRLAGPAGQVVYLHGRTSSRETWERTYEELAKEGFGVVPAEPDPVERDPKIAREIAEKRIEALSGCDGLLLLGAENGRALDADLVVVGRQDRNTARARSDRLLPCGVLDTVGLAAETPRRKTMAQALGIDWIDAKRDVWPDEVKNWMHHASAVVGRI